MTVCGPTTTQAVKERVMEYPGRVLRIGAPDLRIVKALKTQLNRALALQGCNALRLNPDNPVFGAELKQAVQLFPARHVDTPDRPLKTEGEVVPITGAALFGNDTRPAPIPPQRHWKVRR